MDIPELSHKIHLKPSYRTNRVKTFDPSLGDTKKPAGEDVVEAHATYEIDLTTMTAKEVKHPEVRTPYWEFDETARIDQPTECPDCGRQLAAWANADYPDKKGWKAGSDLVFLACPMAGRDIKPCHSGCLVACGRTALEWAEIAAEWQRQEDLAAAGANQ